MGIRMTNRLGKKDIAILSQYVLGDTSEMPATRPRADTLLLSTQQSTMDGEQWARSLTDPTRLGKADLFSNMHNPHQTAKAEMPSVEESTSSSPTARLLLMILETKTRTFNSDSISLERRYIEYALGRRSRMMNWPGIHWRPGRKKLYSCVDRAKPSFSQQSGITGGKGGCGGGGRAQLSVLSSMDVLCNCGWAMAAVSNAGQVRHCLVLQRVQPGVLTPFGTHSAK
ncbi:hypothetical protein B0T21DRAFT_212091 [Apiosordaria backusii]|uniref:Uncharacterized protein n=1 Tax=Apiosordaria backusii TaxID=314023 RepID=A0AA40B841_9PEZI|nr:hypothetical protein B0T21DRAFT_212091 [Apiosordaria backusii]